MTGGVAQVVEHLPNQKKRIQFGLQILVTCNFEYSNKYPKTKKVRRGDTDFNNILFTPIFLKYDFSM
jgi:hypothetical protein